MAVASGGYRAAKLTVFLELRSRKIVRFSEQIMSADKYPSIFLRQMEAIVYISPNFQNCARVFIILQSFYTTSAVLTIGGYLTIIPRARMGSESIAHEAEGRMGY